jgi:hypothetical protein
MIFRLFQDGVQIKTRSNKDNVYMSLKNAKIALKNYLTRVNKKVPQKNLQIKAENCEIIGFDLVEKVKYSL